MSRYLVSDRDDGDAALTFRSMVLGTAFTALSSVITMLYTFKPTQMQVSAVFIQRKSAPSAFILLESLNDGNTRHMQFWSTLPARHGRWQHRPQTERNGPGSAVSLNSSTPASHSASRNTSWRP